MIAQNTERKHLVDSEKALRKPLNHIKDSENNLKSPETVMVKNI